MVAGIKKLAEGEGWGREVRRKDGGKGKLRGEGGGEDCWRRTGTDDEERLGHLQCETSDPSPF